MKKFLKGSTYFKALYLSDSDRDLDIESLVFIGKNLKEFASEYKEDQDFWVFQDAYSYFNYGSYPTSHSVETRLEILGDTAINAIYSHEELAGVLVGETNSNE